MIWVSEILKIYLEEQLLRKHHVIMMVIKKVLLQWLIKIFNKNFLGGDFKK